MQKVSFYEELTPTGYAQFLETITVTSQEVEACHIRRYLQELHVHEITFNEKKNQVQIYCIINCVACYMFRPPIVAIFREVFLEGCITQNVKWTYKYKMLLFYILTQILKLLLKT